MEAYKVVRNKKYFQHMQFEEDEIRQSDEDPEFTGGAVESEVDDEFIDDDMPLTDDDDGLGDDDEDEDDAPAADL